MNNENERYLSIMIDSLRRKSSILDDIIEENIRQSEILGRSDRASEDDLQDSIDKKSDMIDRLTELDDGFSQLYEKIEIALNAESASYAQQIATMQDLIREITDKTVKIETQESRNKSMASIYFSGALKRVNEKRATRNAAEVYRKNMKKIQVVGPQFMDKSN